MHQKWQRWNTASRKWLWILVVLGIIAAIPVIYDRYRTESSSNNVELVYNYRGLVETASYQAHPEEYLQQQLDQLKAAGVTSMAMFESTLDDFKKSRRIMMFNAGDVASMTKSVIPTNDNYTYILFTNEENAGRLSPLIEDTFTGIGIGVKPWEFNGQKGLILETSPEDAVLKPMQPDPIAFEMLRSKGFNIVPRMSDSLPYNQEAMDKLLAYYQANGVKRVLFEGDSVKGFNDNEDMNSLQGFANLLNQYGIGIAAIENLKQPQKGLSKLAYDTDYNVARLYSLSDRDAAALSPETIADRFALATKDRNIRMLYINVAPSRNMTKATITDSVDNIVKTLQEPGNAIKQMENNGFKMGQAGAFHIYDSAGQRYFKMVVVLGGVAFVALLVSYFIPALTLIAFVLGLIGSAGLYVLKPTLFEQALALLVAISAPTIAVLLAVRKLNEMNAANAGLTSGRRFAHAVVIYIKTAIISLSAIPFVIALLNNITYSLVLNQFRGVSLLHLAPIGLIAIYVVLYRGGKPLQQIGKLFRTPITLTWVVAAGVIGVLGLYYLSRTGNGGSVSSIEMTLRTVLENTFHVRPRNKELVAHALFLLGIFVSLRYRNVVYLMIFAVIGQLSMVDTFAHIHSPMKISFVRDLLGLGLGFIFGLIAIGVWQVLEGCWKRWVPRLRRP
ncbi:hypothetical protein BCV73_31075 [Paenibacillus sp. SSG-1]|uniref:Uncharacterized protein n=1 Tax=Paenibacillus cineris TaxID=237530 RepID=A0ABQ4LKU4_9BACL|nr:MULTISPECIES: DUF5693 family protein [Paenibacillus]OXL87027.1 hypothetical protein BCV73_31075 [Paenibacillus sp. SSG-1]UYO05221.1 hypothetical protein K2F33_04485 [Paenibacillus sp. PSB04]GIO57141.1 hypothetical protein J21TS7_54590 [Paenibacillus cineris]